MFPPKVKMSSPKVTIHFAFQFTSPNFIAFLMLRNVI